MNRVRISSEMISGVNEFSLRTLLSVLSRQLLTTTNQLSPTSVPALHFIVNSSTCGLRCGFSCSDESVYFLCVLMASVFESMIIKRSGGVFSGVGQQILSVYYLLCLLCYDHDVYSGPTLGPTNYFCALYFGFCLQT